MGSIRLQNPAHAPALLQKANQLRLAGTLCDVCIVVDGLEFRAHRAVLACASKMFEILFGRESRHYTLDFLSPRTFGQILDYAYTSALVARPEDLDDLLYAAEILEMEFLEEQCLRILETLQQPQAPTQALGQGEAQGPQGEVEQQQPLQLGSKKDMDEEDREASIEDQGPGRGLQKRCRRRGMAEPIETLTTGSKTLAMATSINPPSSDTMVETTSESTLVQGHARNFFDNQMLFRTEGVPKMVFDKSMNAVPRKHKSNIKLEEEAMQLEEVSNGRGGCQDDGNSGFDDRPETPSKLARGSVITSARHLGQGPEESMGGAESLKVQSELMTLASLYGIPPMSANHIPPLAMPPPLHLQLDFGPYGGLLSPSFLQRDYLSKLVSSTANDCHRRSNRCEVCGLDLPDEDAMEKHRKLHREIPSHTCQLCGKTFLDSLRLRMHMMSHTAGEKAILCGQCGAQFQKEEDLESHKLTHTGSDMAVFCLLCGKRFLTQSGLRQHTETHAGLRSYVCSDCDCTFPSNTALKRHLRSHTGDHPYECEFCGSCFRDDMTLKGHKRIHTGDKPYQCNSCGKKFSLKHQLETHYRVHTGEKPFECKLCHQRSRDYSAMIKHLRTHNGASPYQCTLCQEYCASLSAMQKHIKSHPPEDVPPDWRIDSTYLYLCYV